MTRNTSTTLLCLGMTLAWLPACNAGRDADPGPPAERVATVEVIEVLPETAVEHAVLSADLLPLRRAVLAAEVSGVVETLLIEEGQRVEQGVVVAHVDTRALQQGLNEAEALFRQAEADFQRAESLFASRSITRQQHIGAATAKDVALARKESALLQLEKSAVKAPWPGTVAATRVEVGDYVNPGQPMVELVEIRRLKVRGPAPAADVPFLKVGTPVTITVDAFPGERFTASIARLAAELDMDARTLWVEAELPNPGERLRPGLFARMEIPRRTLKGAVMVPLEALIDMEVGQAVYRVEEGVARLSSVTLGAVIGERVVVLDGVSGGDQVIVAGRQQVSDGQRVAVTNGR